jgi:hypothetical protein
MIQDLCLALKGVPGAIFTFDECGSFRKFSRKAPSILFVGGEIDILNNILELGTLRAKIYEYTSTSQGKSRTFQTFPGILNPFADSRLLRVPLISFVTRISN